MQGFHFKIVAKQIHNIFIFQNLAFNFSPLLLTMLKQSINNFLLAGGKGNNQGLALLSWPWQQRFHNSMYSLWGAHILELGKIIYKIMLDLKSVQYQSIICS